LIMRQIFFLDLHMSLPFFTAASHPYKSSLHFTVPLPSFSKFWPPHNLALLRPSVFVFIHSQ
jgi:hypothetical protein